MTQRTHRVSIVVLALALIAGLPAFALADPDKVNCDVVEISATSGDKPSIPADLKPLEKKLKKKPFSSWNVFTVLSKSTQTLEKLKAATVKLTKGQAGVLYSGSTQSAKKTRIGLTVTTDDENGKRIADTKVSIDAGDYIVIGRTLANDDGHLLALTCKPGKAE
jgi:hypothetical protein